MDATTLIQLQHTVGNRAIQRYLHHEKAGKPYEFGHLVDQDSEHAEAQELRDPGPAAIVEQSTQARVLVQAAEDAGQRPTLRQGSTGPSVRLLQEKLRGTGRFAKVDGVFGADTTAYVRDFQAKMKLPVDGVVGSRTWEALDAVSRGGAVSVEDQQRIIKEHNEGRALRDAGQHAAALAKFKALYSDPLLASKPQLLQVMVWNIANSLHHLAFAPEVKEADRRAKLDEAISWYQEFIGRQGADPTKHADAINAIRRCRLGQPPQSLAEMEAEKHKMGEAIEGVEPGKRPALSSGSTGPYVRLLQEKLRGTGRFAKVDGVFGADTTAYVRDFQAKMKLPVDGVVGSRTWEALDAVSRGGAVSVEDQQRIIKEHNEGRALRDAGQHAAALAKFKALYSDPLLASKPQLLQVMVWNIANSLHHLAFAPKVKDAERKTKLDEAISWYQEFIGRQGADPTKRADAINAIRRCRLGQPPQSLAEMEAEKHKMGEAIEGVEPGKRPALSSGSTGPYVRLLQEKLRGTGRFAKVDGVFGADTAAYVRDFQAKMKLKADGVVGSRTWEALDAVSRGGAVSVEDQQRIIKEHNEGRALRDAGQHAAALAKFKALYSDPLLASKPQLLQVMVWNIANSLHHLAFAPEVKEAERKAKLDEAISWYQEFIGRQGADPTKHADAINAIRRCRLGQPPQSLAEMEAEKHKMGEAIEGVEPGKRPALSSGSTGPYVRLLQEKLRGTGRFAKVDGVFGADTAAYVRDFQAKMKLPVDGVVGSRTWEALDAVSRGGAVSVEDQQRIIKEHNEGRALRDAGQHAAALAKFKALYSDPLLASKPQLLQVMVWNIANSLHHLAFAPKVKDAERKAKLDEAISWYQEFIGRQGADPTKHADAINAIRRCRLGQPPQSLAEMEAEKHKMGG